MHKWNPSVAEFSNMDTLVPPLVIDAPEDRSRKVDDDTVILSNVQSGTSAVYQCNASNEFGYLLANAFVNVLGEPSAVKPELQTKTRPKSADV